MNYKEKFWKQGFLHLPAIYNKNEIQQLTTDLEWMMVDWAENTPGWSGPWRKKYMDSETNKKSKLIHHPINHLSQAESLSLIVEN